MMRPSLRIGYLNQDFFPEVGAGPARVLEMSRHWQARGAVVTIVAGMPNRRIPGRGEGGVDPRYQGKRFIEEEWEGVRTLRTWVHAGSGRGFRDKLVNMASFMASGFLRASVPREKFDVLIASSPPFPPHISGVALAKLKGIPLVLEIRDLWPDYMVEMGMLANPHAQRALFGLERWLLARADRVVVVTESFRQRVIGKGVPRERTDVISNGVDLDQYYRGDEPAPMPELERRGDEIVVGYLGTFGAGQQLATVVQAAALLRDVRPAIRIVLVGDGPDLPAIRAAVTELSASNVTIAPPIQRTQTRAFYNACDICLVPLAPLKIFQETVPSKIFEIMACERPLVASLSGEGASIIEASGGGLRCPPGDARALSDAILQMATTPDAERRAMGARAREYVAANYSRAALADRYLSILTKVVAENRARR
jgi:colanic acid biosynthesis glycosyl transferase WcaI